MITLLATVVSIVFVEITLRHVAKIHPGFYGFGPDFRLVDSLYELQGFAADSEGIFLIADKSRTDIQARIASPDKFLHKKLYNPELEVDEIYTIIDEFRLLKEKKVQNHFADYYYKIESKDTDSLSELEEAILQYVCAPINENGFLSIPFKSITGGKKKVLLLGDSFTWGRTVSNITRSFANELLAMGYAVYNTGISGADPPQYMMLAKKLIPLLKPDVVIVNFYMGNDISFFPRSVLPYHKLMYRTNAGYLMGCPSGHWFANAEEAYQHIKAELSIPLTTAFNRFCALSALGTLCWKALFQVGWVESYHAAHQEYYDTTQKLLSDTPYCNNELLDIIAIAESHQAKCVVSVISDMAHDYQRDPKQTHNLFKDIPYVLSPVNESGYSKGDWHFNDEGHREYALFLDSLCRVIFD